MPVVVEALQSAGRDTERIAIDDLAATDEFHALGRSATTALADLAGEASIDVAWMQAVAISVTLWPPAATSPS